MRTKLWLAGAIAVALVATLTSGGPTLNDPSRAWTPPATATAPDVPVREVAAGPVPPWRAEHAAVRGDRAVRWPSGGTARLTLSAGLAGQAGIPVRVGPAQASATATAPAAVTVGVADRAATAAAGVGGLLLKVARDDGTATPTEVAVEVDYSGFRHAYGGDWASRLRISVLSAAGPRPLSTLNNKRAGTLRATVPLDGLQPTALAVSAAAEGDNGDYKATSLSPTGTWQVSQQTGDFAYSYPLRVVPTGLNGPEPELALSYSSSSIDGRTANTNTQGSWIGDGWDLWPGYIERTYQTCLSDMDAVGGQDPNNKGNQTGDQCWFSDNATMSLNGQATELVRDGDGRYRGVADDGSRIERLTGATNDDDNGEYWKVTTTDGAQYFFGRNTAGNASTWTVPVYGNHPGEPCHASGFAGSRCTQAWRWNLDRVVDPHGNSMALFYAKETGAYGREGKPDLRTTYDRGGYLRRIEYGTRTGTEQVPARVVFEEADRCKPGATCTQSNASAWPDVPWDMYCDDAPCTDQLAPTFWTQKRLSKIRAQVWRGSDFADVESWTLRHEYLDAGETDGEGVPMWLRGITRTGHVTTAGGAAVSDPEVTFDPSTIPLENRVEGPNDGRTALNRWRLHTIRTESGAEIGISYSERQCTRASLPTPHTNTKRCFPQWYAPSGLEPTLDWFHKYVVTRVDVHDNTGASAHQQTNYRYLDDPAWHYDDSELVKPKKRTWGQYRGYSKVQVRKGFEGIVQSVTEYLYLRGMHGDREAPSGGTKSVQITDSHGTAVTDHEAHNGFLREETVYDGANWVSGSIHDPWRHGPTATAGPLKAYLTDVATTRERVALAAGGTRWTRTTTAFDTTYGMKTQEDDLGDEASPADDRCVRYEYARNTATWMVDKVRRTETVGVRCSVTPQRPADVLSDERTFYDDATTFGTTPTRGLAVRTQEVSSWNGSTPVWQNTTRASFDVHGRQVEVFDALDRKSTTNYTPAAGGPVTATTATSTLGHTAISTMERAWHLPTRTVDANGRVTDLAYDGLGRLTKVWLPGRAKATATPNLEYAYLVRTTAPSTVTTRKLMPTGNTYQTSVTLYDGQLRDRQTQTQAPGGGRVVTDKIYDSRGLVEWESRGYFATGAPSNTLVTVSGQPQIPGITAYVHDGAERVRAEIFKNRGVEAWRKSTSYGGDRTHVTPPPGGTAITTITDARDRVVARVQTTETGQQETKYTYTGRDELATVTDAMGNVWTYTYDQRGRVKSTTDPDKGTTTTTYDAEGQVLTVTDARQLTIGYTYDDLGRRTSIRDGSTTGPKRAEWVFDTLPGGKGELTRSIRYEGGAQYVTEVVGYDPAGRATGTRIVIPAAETGLDGTYTTAVTYRPDGSIHASELPALGDLPAERMVPAYNEVGGATSLVSQHGSYVYSAAYKSTGELSQRVLGEFGKRVSVNYTYDDATARLTNTAAVPELGAEILDLAYSYDHTGNLLRIADSPGGDTPSDTQCFRYDGLRQLTAAWTPASGACAAAPALDALGGAAPYWHAYSYDAVGNRRTETRHAASGSTTTAATHPAARSPQPHTVTRATVSGPGGSTLNTYGYDAAGNMTSRDLAGTAQALTWDSEGNLRTADDVSYVYDADGNRLVRRDSTGRTLYLPGGSELRYTAATKARNGTRYYTHLDTTVAVRTAAGVTILVTDHHNTAEVAVRASDLSVARRRTTPFGDLRGPAPAFWAGDKGFVGGTQDPTGLTNLGAREYDPALGRFISVDPMIDTGEPQTLNGYAYGNNAPPTFTDPDGLFFKKLWNRATSTVSQAVNTAQNVGNAVANGVATAARATANFATETVNTIREDPWRFAAEVAVGIAAAAAVAAVCSTGVGCVILAGAVAGAAAAGAGYGVDVGQGDREFSARDLATEMAVGAVVGGATAGVGRFAGGRLASRFNRGCNSFVPGTAVALADGTRKPIEEVQLGDRVLATDPGTGATSAQPVVATIIGHGGKELVEITVEPVGGDATGSVTATDNHPIWVVNRGEWVDAGDLRPGDVLLAPDGARVRVLAVVAYGAVATVHNLTVANVHTYYVGAGDAEILTHNTGPGRCPIHQRDPGVVDLDPPSGPCPCQAEVGPPHPWSPDDMFRGDAANRPAAGLMNAVTSASGGRPSALAGLGITTILTARAAWIALRRAMASRWSGPARPSITPRPGAQPRPTYVNKPRPTPPRRNRGGGGGGGGGPNFFI